MMKIFSKIISGVLSPFLIPTYIYAVLIGITYTATLHFYPILIIIGTVLFLTAIVPYTSFMWNKFNTENYNEKSDIYSYLNIGICYIVTAYVLIKLGLPTWMSAFLFSGIILLILVAVLKRNYNISAHMTAYGAYLGAVFIIAKFTYNISLDFIIVSLLLGGLLGSSRVYLKEYTPGGIITGTILGFVWSYYGALLAKLIL